MSTLHLFGIRHHGPGSARSLRQSLDSLEPDLILVEGPPDAAGVIEQIVSPDMSPPVAILIYAPEQPQQAVYYPFAVFSPEWQALDYGLQQQIPVQWMDLPQTHQLALRQQLDQQFEPPEADGDAGNVVPESSLPEIRHDPLFWLAQAAGFNDSERWWERMVEQRSETTDLFPAIVEAMSALRLELEKDHPLDLNNNRDYREALREAYMRQTIRKAKRAGHEKIAIICGAWHTPALAEPFPPAKQDSALLKGLPKLKVTSTWIPWTYERLANRSGYGAGITSPGWYHHLWTASDQPTVRWLTHVAQLLRQAEIDASSASVIEAVRLANSLAALRDCPTPGLPELNEAAQTVLCFGEELPLQLIHERLIISDRMGQVPDDTPMVPLQVDLQRWQKKLRLKPSVTPKELSLDLRKPNDLLRSQLLHRLNLLGIPWGRPTFNRGKGTFKEAWILEWQPEFEIALIEAGQWGNTIEAATTAYTCYLADNAANLPTLTELLDQVLLADLPDAITQLMARLQTEAAVASDVVHLMSALPPLAQILRYRDVRQTDTDVVAHVVDGLVTRICIGLPGACASLDDDAAAMMDKQIMATHSAINLLQNQDHQQMWWLVLKQLVNRETLHGLLGGRSCRLLLDGGQFEPSRAAQQLGLALSLATEPTQAAAWIEGFLKGSGLLLLHDQEIWQVLDQWVCELAPDTFVTLLPLLRRTFSTFPAAERRQMGERVIQGVVETGLQGWESEVLDCDRAEKVLPLIAQLLGLSAHNL
ncbi:DUF5682 family protein [Acaryochloris sp. CCMEE 5410]|uniref:DUF5682 family protein n=1 Tax=Acaryochloris sp. CCMEE 5410 TaxID=310037 RepID=UPI0002485310|nr:DUF5682 family protein [Acaryochloris sp. CCMEE 5410]KAI9133747.1 hypothetical protein ON05_010885 [Acaryochloris sp. CCMEE 5410]